MGASHPYLRRGEGGGEREVLTIWIQPIPTSEVQYYLTSWYIFHMLLCWLEPHKGQVEWYRAPPSPNQILIHVFYMQWVSLWVLALWLSLVEHMFMWCWQIPCSCFGSVRQRALRPDACIFIATCSRTYKSGVILMLLFTGHGFSLHGCLGYRDFSV